MSTIAKRFLLHFVYVQTTACKRKAIQRLCVSRLLYICIKWFYFIADVILHAFHLLVQAECLVHKS